MNFTANRREPARTKRRFKAGSLCLRFRSEASPDGSWLVILFLFVFTGLYAQSLPGGRNDTETARQYVQWIRQAVDEGRWSEARAALIRAGGFENVSSDISYLSAVTRLHYLFENETRITVLQALDAAIETNRWVYYSENDALLLKAEQLAAMRDYFGARRCLAQIPADEAAGGARLRADAAMLNLLALRGTALSGETELYSVQERVHFRSEVLRAMDRFSRDPRPLRIFFEYARNVEPQTSDLPDGDIYLLELAMRRLPFLLETDPELAWMAAPFMRDVEAAKRLVASYRAGGISHIQNRDFRPHPGSIPAALNLGLLGDIEAAEELFSGSRGFNYPLNSEIKPDGNPVLDKNIIIDAHKLLRSEEGRVFFTQKLLSFTGIIFSDDDRDGFIDSLSYYRSGILTAFSLDRNQSVSFDFEIIFDSSGAPVSGKIPLEGRNETAHVFWERYPSVQMIELNKTEFKFRPADFQFAPAAFIELGGSNNLSGLSFPAPAYQYLSLTYHTLVSMCSSLTRPSLEFEGALETIYMERQMPLQAVEVLNDRRISVAEFSGGLPVIQRVDLDLDGRMETIRRFRIPYRQDEVSYLDYRSLIASSESDWSGDGRNKTMEVYRQDGSIVYYFDMDGGGEWTYSETRYPR